MSNFTIWLLPTGEYALIGPLGEEEEFCLKEAYCKRVEELPESDPDKAKQAFIKWCDAKAGAPNKVVPVNMKRMLLGDEDG
jgi:hypothetical protein